MRTRRCQLIGFDFAVPLMDCSSSCTSYILFLSAPVERKKNEEEVEKKKKKKKDKTIYVYRQTEREKGRHK